MIWVNIPEGAVHLEAGTFRCGKQRLNRWIGRIVRLNRTDQDLVTTGKLYCEGITLKRVGPRWELEPLCRYGTLSILWSIHSK